TSMRGSHSRTDITSRFIEALQGSASTNTDPSRASTPTSGPSTRPHPQKSRRAEFFLSDKRGLNLVNLARARKYPFPGGIDVERFTVFVLEPTESSATYSAKFNVGVRQGELALVEERYRDGVLYEVDIHRHGDRLSTFLPSAVVDWLVPIPRHCPDLRMRLSANSGIPEW
ncbi:MAG: hypothetical protein OXF65_14855, partial [Acidimicrobiaceae bacterium]|nr:hypothetical protein [Acidimicrobiaceae bacterium]